MSVYLITFHAFGPRNESGEPRFVLRDAKERPATPRQRLPLAERYARAIADREVNFDADHQRLLVDTLIDTEARLGYRCLGAAADAWDVHAVVAWTTRQSAIDLRSAIKSSLGQRLDREFGRQAWFGPGGGAKRVRNRTQFDYLLQTFLPKRGGLVWTAYRGFADRLAASA